MSCAGPRRHLVKSRRTFSIPLAAGPLFDVLVQTWSILPWFCEYGCAEFRYRWTVTPPRKLVSFLSVDLCGCFLCGMWVLPASSVIW